MKIKRQTISTSAKLLGVGSMALLSGCQGDKQPPQLPNVVLIYMDDLGYGDMGAYGATAVETPHMDRLAHGGVRFTNGYSSSATSTPAGTRC